MHDRRSFLTKVAAGTAIVWTAPIISSASASAAGSCGVRPQFRSASGTTGAAGVSSLTVSPPAGIQVGDVLLAVATLAGDQNANISAPAGWSVPFNNIGINAQQSRVSLCTRKVTGGESYTFTKTGGGVWAIGIVAYRLTSAIPGNPQQQANSTTPVTAPSLVVQGNELCGLVVFLGSTPVTPAPPNPVPWTAPTGFTFRFFQGTQGFPDIYVADRPVSSPGPTGSVSASTTPSRASLGMHLLLLP